MKKIIRLTESELKRIINNSVRKIIKEDVLGNDWREAENDVMNNYEPFELQKQDDNDNNWGIKGEEGLDQTNYDNFSDDIVNGYEEDPDWYRNDVMVSNDDPSDGDLYYGGLL